MATDRPTLTEAEVQAIKAETVAGFGNEPPSRVYAARVLALCEELLAARDGTALGDALIDLNAALEALGDAGTRVALEEERDAALEREQVLRGKWLKLSRAYPECFVCPECGPLVRADEDGCCATCGSDTTIRPTRAALGAKETP